mmetsp:Transcript_9199/g.26172  ORF Transcript_9199/g.26172 Transcript_9199/m.26172 type:complete len:209 (-) Transcript_9199:360-986(-)
MMPLVGSKFLHSGRSGPTVDLESQGPPANLCTPQAFPGGILEHPRGRRLRPGQKRERARGPSSMCCAASGTHWGSPPRYQLLAVLEGHSCSPRNAHTPPRAGPGKPTCSSPRLHHRWEMRGTPSWPSGQRPYLARSEGRRPRRGEADETERPAVFRATCLGSAPGDRLSGPWTTRNRALAPGPVLPRRWPLGHPLQNGPALPHPGPRY